MKLFRPLSLNVLIAAFVSLLFTQCGTSETAESSGTGHMAQTTANIERVSPNDFAVRMTGGGTMGVQVIDVRTPKEFNSGHIEGAVNIDISKRDVFNNRVDGLDKNRPVLVYCEVGGRSAAAANLLSSKGFVQIVDLDGGMAAWRSAGKTVVR